MLVVAFIGILFHRESEGLKDLEGVGSVSATVTERFGQTDGTDRDVADLERTLSGGLEEVARGKSSSFDRSETLQVSIFKKTGTDWPIRSERNESAGPEDLIIPREMVADRLLVTLNGQDAYEPLVEWLESRNAWVVGQIGKDELTFVVSFSNYDSLDRLPELRESLFSEKVMIRSVEPDFIFKASLEPNESVFPIQYAMHSPDDRSSYLRADINASEGWELRTTAENQLIAVIDSGVELSHPDLQPNLWVSEGETLDGADSDGNGYVDDLLGLDLLNPGQPPLDITGHGTAVAGLIGAVGNNGKGIAGVVWSTEILPIRFLDGNNLGTASDAVRAIDYAVAQGATIINASWGGVSKSLVLERAIKRATAAGVLFVAAAGNEGWDIDVNPIYPACFDNEGILSVGSVTNRGELSRFSNYGIESVDIVAPGEGVRSLSLGDEELVETFTGTSFAAPLVTGIAALAREQFGETDPIELRNRILRGARLRDSGYSNLETVLSRGYADLARVLAGKTNVPANDLFSGAIALGPNNYSYSGSGNGTSLESDEPLVAGSETARSVWFQLVGIPAGEFEINVRGVGSNHGTALFEGSSVSSLLAVGQWSEATTAGIQWKGSLSGNGPYYLRVASEELEWYNVELRINPVNDDFAKAIVVDRFPFTSRVNNRFASAEDYEPRPRSGYDSVWWKLDTGASSSVFLDTNGSEVDTMLSVYQGFSFDDLKIVTLNDDLDSGSVSSGATVELATGASYFVQVVSKFGGGQIVLNGSVLRAPVITSQPKDVTALLGARRSLRVVVVGADPVSYQWYHEGSPVTEGTSPVLTIDAVAEENLGSYHVAVTTPYGSVTSESATVQLLGSLPVLVEQPKSWDYLVGQEITLSVVPLRDEGVSYQWFKGGAVIPQATGRVFRISNATTSASGSYSVVASNRYGSTESEVATVFVSSSEYELVARTSFEEPYFDLLGGVELDGGAMWYAVAGQDLLQSVDGFDWQPVTILIDGEEPRYGIEEILYGNGIFVVASSLYAASGPSLQALTESVSKPATLFLSKFHNGYFYGHGLGSAYRSEDGSSWTKIDAQYFPYGGIVGGDGLWGVLAGDALIYSRDFEEWIQREFQEGFGHIRGYTFSEGKFLFVDHHGDIYQTTDATSFAKVGNVPITRDDTIFSFSKVGEIYVVATIRRLYYARSFDDWKIRENGSGYFKDLFVVGDSMMGDGPSVSPHRLFHDGLPQDSKPIITPVDWKPYFRIGVGEALSLSVIISDANDPVVSARFMVDGQLVQTSDRQSEYRFEWATQNRGSYVAQVEALTEGGERSVLTATVEVGEDNFKTVFDRDPLMTRIRAIETFKGSVYAVSAGGGLYRRNGLEDWLLLRFIDVGQIWELFELNGELWVVGERAIVASQDGLSWNEVLRLDHDDRFVRGKGMAAWVKRGDGNALGSARLYYDSKRYFDLEGIFDRFEGLLLGGMYRYLIDNSYQLEVLAPGNRAERFDFPVDAPPYSIAEEGRFAYFLFGDNEFYRTDNFVDWDLIDLRPLEAQSGVEGESSILFEDGLFVSSSGFVSTDLERWYKNWSGTVFGVESDLDGTFWLAVEDGLYHMTGYADFQKISDLPRNDSSRGFLKSEEGFYSWGGWSEEVWFSDLGLEWQQVGGERADYRSITDIAFGNGVYIAVGGRQILSGNGIEWAEQRFWDHSFTQIEYGNGVFVACNSNKYYSDDYAYSFDGVNWNQSTLPASTSGSSELAFNSIQSLFLLTTRADTLYKSTDGIHWEKAADFQSARELRAVGEFFYLKDGVGREYYSRNGSDWARTEEAAYVFSKGLYYSGDWKLMVSDDGINWEDNGRLNGVSTRNAVSFRDGLLFSGGSNGTYYQFDGGSWERLWTQPAVGFLKEVNGKVFALSDKIELFIDSDLAVLETRLASTADHYLVSDFIEVELELKNVGASSLSFDSLEVEGRLLEEDETWSDRVGSLLSRAEILELELNVGETETKRIRFEIPSGVKPGNYRIGVLVNPRLDGETTLANNYGWTHNANVEIPAVSLSVAIEGSGRAEVLPQRTIFAKGDKALVRALPNPKNEYVGWNGGNIGGTNLIEVELPSDTNITLYFEPIRYPLEWSSLGQGNVIFPDGQKDLYLAGESVTLFAEPKEGWEFVEWVGSVESQDYELELFVSEPLSLTAVFGQSFESWRSDKFSEDQLLSESIVGKFADADGDTLSNIQEYLSGSDPNNSNDQNPPTFRIEDDRLIASFSVNLSAVGYLLKPEVFSASDGWVVVTTEMQVQGEIYILTISVSLDDGVRLVRLTFAEYPAPE